MSQKNFKTWRDRSQFSFHNRLSVSLEAASADTAMFNSQKTK